MFSTTKRKDDDDIFEYEIFSIQFGDSLKKGYRNVQLINKKGPLLRWQRLRNNVNMDSHRGRVLSKKKRKVTEDVTFLLRVYTPVGNIYKNHNTYTDCQHDFLFLRPRAIRPTCFQHISFISCSIQIVFPLSPLN